MSEGDNDLKRDVSEWLSRGGYILEMAVAQRLAARFAVMGLEQGYHYRDPVEDVEREGDVTATYFPMFDSPRGHAFSLMIECKSTNAPWVFFLGPTDSASWIPSISFDADCGLCEALVGGLFRHLYAGPIAYAATQKHSPEEGKRRVDHAYMALQQVTAATLAAFPGNGCATHTPENADQFAFLGVPIVVTNSPLFTCKLESDASLAVDRVNRIAVQVPRTGLPEDGQGILVTVISLDRLDAVLDDLGEVAVSAGGSVDLIL